MPSFIVSSRRTLRLRLAIPIFAYQCSTFEQYRARGGWNCRMKSGIGDKRGKKEKRNDRTAIRGNLHDQGTERIESRREAETRRVEGEKITREEGSLSLSENLVQHARVRKCTSYSSFFPQPFPLLEPLWRLHTCARVRSPVSSVSSVPISQLVEMRS